MNDIRVQEPSASYAPAIPNEIPRIPEESSEEDDVTDEEDERDLEGRTVTRRGLEVI